MGFGLALLIAGILLLCAAAYAVDVFIIGAEMRRIRRLIETELRARYAPAMGEFEQIYQMFEHFMAQPFTYARMACYAVIVLLPIVFILNVMYAGAYMHYNFVFCIVIVIMMVKMGLRFEVILGALGLGGLTAILQSKEGDEKDISIGALKGLQALAKVMGTIVVGVWMISIILSLVPFHDSPASFWIGLISLFGMQIWSAVRGYKRVEWLLDAVVLIFFLGTLAFAVSNWLHLDWAPFMGYLGNQIPRHAGKVNFSAIVHTLGSVGMLAILGFGIYFYIIKTEKEED